jgi:transposase
MDRNSLEGASREQLLALIDELSTLVGELQARVAELEAKLGGASSGPGFAEFIKPSGKKPAEPRSRRRRAQAFVRRRETPTERVEHALDSCQGCGCHLQGGSVKRRRQVVHIALAPVQVIEHVYIERRCPVCGKRNVPRVELAGQVVGKNRLSSSTMAMIASLREVAHMPLSQIGWLLESFYKLKVSLGEIVRVLRTVAQRAAGTVAGLLVELRSSAVVHADETGWREEGQNGYLWSFSTDRVHYVVERQSRASEVVREVLGEDFSGVLVSDFYSAYNCYEGPHQRCWVHLLRDVHELKERSPDDDALLEWARQVHEFYLEAKATSGKVAHLPWLERAAARQELEERVLALATPYLEADVPQRRLCQRIDRFLDQLLTFVELPLVPSDNNAAERAIRAQVVARKISGGTRSTAGSTTKATLASIFSTWQRQGLNPFLACQQLLNSP